MSITPPDPRASRFTKSRSNRLTEKEGASILLRDARFQAVDVATKRRILELIGTTTEFGIQTFDLVMTPQPVPPISAETVESLFPDLRLVEMKVTKKPIRNEALNGFFFGATERERVMATKLGDRYLFAFVVLASANDYAAPFAVLLSLRELESRTGQWRVQYQVNFRSDIGEQDLASSHQLVILGNKSDLDETAPLEAPHTSEPPRGMEPV